MARAIRRESDPLAELVRPVSRRLRQAAWLSVASGLIWPVQAALVVLMPGGLLAAGGGRHCRNRHFRLYRTAADAL